MIDYSETVSRASSLVPAWERGCCKMGSGSETTSFPLVSSPDPSPEKRSTRLRSHMHAQRSYVDSEGTLEEGHGWNLLLKMARSSLIDFFFISTSLLPRFSLRRTPVFKSRFKAWSKTNFLACNIQEQLMIISVVSISHSGVYMCRV